MGASALLLGPESWKVLRELVSGFIGEAVGTADTPMTKPNVSTDEDRWNKSKKWKHTFIEPLKSRIEWWAITRFSRFHGDPRMETGSVWGYGRPYRALGCRKRLKIPIFKPSVPVSFTRSKTHSGKSAAACGGIFIAEGLPRLWPEQGIIQWIPVVIAAYEFLLIVSEIARTEGWILLGVMNKVGVAYHLPRSDIWRQVSFDVVRSKERLPLFGFMLAIKARRRPGETRRILASLWRRTEARICAAFCWHTWKTRVYAQLKTKTGRRRFVETFHQQAGIRSTK